MMSKDANPMRKKGGSYGFACVGSQLLTLPIKFNDGALRDGQDRMGLDPKIDHEFPLPGMRINQRR
jgi:hypothetical protein